MAAPAAVTFDDMRDLAAREARRLAIWEDVDGHKRRDREIHEAMIRMIDAVQADPVIVERLKAVVRKQLKEAAAAQADTPLPNPPPQGGREQAAASGEAADGARQAVTS